jgi:hypothetical protein
MHSNTREQANCILQGPQRFAQRCASSLLLEVRSAPWHQLFTVAPAVGEICGRHVDVGRQGRTPLRSRMTKGSRGGRGGRVGGACGKTRPAFGLAGDTRHYGPLGRDGGTSGPALAAGPVVMVSNCREAAISVTAMGSCRGARRPGGPRPSEAPVRRANGTSASSRSRSS